MSQLASLGGPPVRTKPWPTWPVVGQSEEKAVLEVLRSGKWWHGDKVKAIEEAYARFQDAAFGIACTNGTQAIEIALIAAGVGAGDEVITTPYTFMGTVAAILKANATPVFADIHELSGNLDPDDVVRRITPCTKAIVPVHVGGLPVDIDRFQEIGREHDLKIVYDAAHGWGSQWRGKGVGAYGDYNTYSFQASKNLNSGEGGMVLTCDERLADLARAYHNCGRLAEGGWYEHFLLGSNYRMTEIQAAILLTQLERLEDQTLRRMRTAACLDRLVADIDGLSVPAPDPRVTRRAYHIYHMCYDKQAWDDLPREKLIAAVRAEGVPIGAVWSLMYRMPLFANMGTTGPKACPVSCPFHQADPPDYAQVHLPAAERLTDQTGLWIMQRLFLADESDIQDIADALTKVREHAKELARADLP